MDEIKITIIGAGVVGLAIASVLSKKHENIAVLERNDSFGRETSSRNSEVIHSGIYYPPGSLKARLCVEGAAYLYEYCEKHNIPHRQVGKLIVASEESHLPDLHELFERGKANGVSDLSFIGAKDVDDIEPSVTACAAILSPLTGIFDTHSYMKCLFDECQASGVLFSFGSSVNSIDKKGDGFVIGTENDDYRFLSRIVINSAGLFADHVASMAGIDIDKCGYRLAYYKGSYFSYEKKSPVKTLIYPTPLKDLKGLGVHATLDLGGRLRFGPDSEFAERIDYTVDHGKRDVFYESAAKMIRGLERDAFIPDMAGVRPRLNGYGVPDFVIRHEADKGLDHFINLIGIESPGLTASLSIAKHVENMIEEITF